MARRIKDDPFRLAERDAVAERRVGIGAICSVPGCGESRPLALIPGSNPMVCAKHDRLTKGRTPNDIHHVAGKYNSNLTTNIPVNDHRAALSPKQYEWPKETLMNPKGSPALVAAGMARGIADTGTYNLNRLYDIAELFERMDAQLKKTYGEEWWMSEDVDSNIPRLMEKLRHA